MKIKCITLTLKTSRLVFAAIAIVNASYHHVSAQQQTLASGLNRPWNLAIDGSSVYWVENDSNTGALRKVPINGGTITTLASGLNQPTAIAVDSSFVYWIDRNDGSNGLLKKIPVDGGSITTIASGLRNAQNHLAQDTSFLYFGDGQAGGGGAIRKVPKIGGSIETLVDTDILNLTTAIAVNENYLYFTDDRNNIKRVPINGGSVTTIGSGSPAAMVLYGNDLFWLEYSAGTVKKMPKSGGPATTLAMGSNSPAGIATDGSSVYWIEFSWPGKVSKVSVDGGSVTTIANEANTIGIAVDNESVYWAIGLYINQGKIQKLGTSPATRVISLSGDLAFGNVTVGASGQQTLTIANTGNSALTVTGISFPSGLSGNWSGGTISAGSTRDVTVTFSPTDAISYSGIVTVNSDATGGANTIPVSATGIDSNPSGEIVATHTAASYSSPGNLTVSCQFTYPANRQLLSLLWRPEIPPGWSLASVAGDGSPEMFAGEIVLVGSLPSSPIKMNYIVQVPTGETSVRQIRNTVEYQLDGTVNPTEISVTPDPLVIDLIRVYSINVSASPTEGGTVSGGGTVNSGTSVTVTATPANNYTFVNWSEEGNVIKDSSETYEFIADGDRSLVANFKQINEPPNPNLPPKISISNPLNNQIFTEPADLMIEVDASDDDGFITLVEFFNGTVRLGQDSEFPYFLEWSDVPEGNLVLTAVATDDQGERTSTEPISVIVTASPQSYTLIISANNGAVSVKPQQDVYESGESVRLTAEPDPGYVFDHWTGDASGSENPKIILMDEDKTITAIFIEGPVSHSIVTFEQSLTNPINVGEAGESVTVNVVRTGDTNDPLTVHYSISGSASHDDYEPLSGTLTIPSGEFSFPLSVIPINDDEVEDQEKVTITLISSPEYEIGSLESVNITIVDNDSIEPGEPLILFIEPSRSVIRPGEVIIYTLTVFNLSGQDLTDVTLEAVIPDYVAFFDQDGLGAQGMCPGVGGYCDPGDAASWQLGLIPSGQSRTVTMGFPFLNEIADGTIIQTSAFVSSQEGLSASDSAPVLVDNTPAVRLAIEDDWDPAQPGQVLRYTLRYSNGASVSAQDVRLMMEVPKGTTFELASDGGTFVDGTVQWDLGELSSGGNGVRRLSVVINSGNAEGGIIIAEATIADGGSHASSERKVTEIRSESGVRLVMEPSRSVIRPGEVVIYTMTVFNEGQQDLTDVTLEAVIPDYVAFFDQDGLGAQGMCPGVGGYCDPGDAASWQLGLIPSGQSRTVTMGVPFLNEIADGTIIQISAFVSSQEGLSASDSAPVLVDNTPAVRLAIEDDWDPAQPGQVLRYTLRYSNGASVSAQDVQLMMEVPKGTTFELASDGGTFVDGTVQWDLGELSSGENGVRRLSVVVNSGNADGRIIVAEATIADGGSHASSERRVTKIRSAPGVRLILEPSRSVIRPGEVVIYTMTVFNESQRDLNDVILEAVVPDYAAFFDEDGLGAQGMCPGVGGYCDPGDAASWQLGPIPSGQSRTVTMGVPTLENISDGTIIQTSAFVSSQEGFSASDSASVLVGKNWPFILPIEHQTVTQGNLLSIPVDVVYAGPANENSMFSLNQDPPSGMSINSTTGEISWTPSSNTEAGEYEVVVQVSDNSPENLSDSRRFLVTVTEPTLTIDPIADVVTNEGERIIFTIAASDSSNQNASITYNLDGDVPDDVVFNAETGQFYWLTQETDGPDEYQIPVRATSSSDPPSTAVSSFTVHINEVNQPPRLLDIEGQHAVAGQKLTFLIQATDDDVPENSLSYSLGSDTPSGAVIDEASGKFEWTPESQMAGTSHTIQVEVSDDGDPPLTATTSFRIIVESPPELKLEGTMLSNGDFRLSFLSELGRTYYIETSSNLKSWKVLEFITGTGETVETSDPSTKSSETKFYRIFSP